MARESALDICTRCLCVFDARSEIMARGRNGDERYEGTRSPAELARWASEKITQGFEIQVDDTRRRFDPVATWHGDPICDPHLWHAIDLENRFQYRGR